MAGKMLSQGQVQSSWQVQHFRKVRLYISPQAQHFRRGVGGAPPMMVEDVMIQQGVR